MKSAIIKKIVLFGILSGAISLLLACFGFGIVEFYKIKNESTVKLTSQLDILAYNLQSTLLFDDKDAADKILLSLRDDKSVIRAKLYKGKQVFSGYVRSKEKAKLKLIKNIFYNGKEIGHLELESIYLGITDKYVAYLFISLVIIIISIPASYFISAPIRTQVSRGVIQLEEQSNRLRMLADQVASTEQRERKRIAELIHDHLQQLLVASKLQLALSLRELDKDVRAKVQVGLTRVEELLSEATQAAKSLTVELRPPVLYEDGLAAAFQWLANKFRKDHKLDIVLHLDEVPGMLPDHLKIMTYESVKELLFNVVKYAGVQTAELFLKYQSGNIIIIVKDKGRGFNVNQMERPADRGFGLFSIRERLKLLDGDLQISSTQGQGTEVRLIIPVDAALSQARQTILAEHLPYKQEKEKTKMIKILLVDDHKIVREGIANLLKENPSFNVVAQAENGIEAVEKAEVYLPKVIIMDVNMPKLNGIEATRVIKNKFPNMEIIGLSVQDENDVAESMKKAGAATLLNKAGDPQELIQTIFSCAGKRA
jgi:signal transduction histidine kinase/CheY-like chemotaxis protein